MGMQTKNNTLTNSKGAFHKAVQVSLSTRAADWVNVPPKPPKPSTSPWITWLHIAMGLVAIVALIVGLNAYSTWRWKRSQGEESSYGPADSEGSERDIDSEGAE